MSDSAAHDPGTPAHGAVKADGDLTIPPRWGRAGRGAASIIPHLLRLKQAQIAVPFHDSDFDPPEPWSVLAPLEEPPR